jgi:hypothetical protein
MSKSEEFGRHWLVILAAVMGESSFLTASSTLATPLAGHVIDHISARPAALFALTRSHAPRPKPYMPSIWLLKSVAPRSASGVP